MRRALQGKHRRIDLSALGGGRQEVAILFTDVWNFTGLAETADPNI